MLVVSRSLSADRCLCFQRHICIAVVPLVGFEPTVFRLCPNALSNLATAAGREAEASRKKKIPGAGHTVRRCAVAYSRTLARRPLSSGRRGWIQTNTPTLLLADRPVQPASTTRIRAFATLRCGIFGRLTSALPCGRALSYCRVKPVG